MFSIPKKNPDNRYGLIMDIGSASVTVGIVASDPNEDLPTLVWSHKERLPLERSKQNPENDIIVATTNAFLAAGSGGIQALIQYEKGAEIKTCNVTISAPWSYNVSRTVRSAAEAPFEITEDVVTELIKNAEAAAFENLDTGMKLEDLGLALIAEDARTITANGYLTTSPIGKRVTELEITRTLGVARKSIIDSIVESHGGIFPKARLHVTTFMFSYYRAMRAIAPALADICLIDVGAETTEIGVVRDSILRHTSHQPAGYYTIAAEVMAATGIPAEEAVASIKQDFATLFTSTTNTQRENVATAIGNYVESTAALFQNAEEILTIPKRVFLHTETGFENFFAPHIEKAASEGNVKRDVKKVNATSFSMADFTEKKLLVSAYVFHKKCFQ